MRVDEVAYDGLPVERWRLVGEEHEGFRLLLHGLNPGACSSRRRPAASARSRWRAARAPRSASCSTARSAPTRRSATRAHARVAQRRG